jgi:hypothetical protein
MDIEFRYDVQYPLKGLRIEKDDVGIYYLALLAVILFQVAGQFITKFKIVHVTRQTSIVTQTALHFAIFSYKAIAMLLLMTCNGGVIIAILVGQFIGYLLFSSKYFRYECPGNLDNRCCT